MAKKRGKVRSQRPEVLSVGSARSGRRSMRGPSFALGAAMSVLRAATQPFAAVCGFRERRDRRTSGFGSRGGIVAGLESNWTAFRYIGLSELGWFLRRSKD